MRVFLVFIVLTIAAVPLPHTKAFAQRPVSNVHLHLAFPGNAKRPQPPAVVWLKPVEAMPELQFPQHQTYTLLQKNRTFIPHLLVVPVATEVFFPNADPFYHNVFSLFDGKRFDLGLYEAGSTKGVTFSREGVSYIFCNIHPEMSAVVVALTTPLYSIADSAGAIDVQNVPAGEYELHTWVEGVPQPVLDRLTHRVHVGPNGGDLGLVSVPIAPVRTTAHTNKFGQPYDKDSKPTY
jgi:plastocyanin